MGVGKLLVFGATSATGQLIVRRALELGWQVTVCGRRTLPEHSANADIKTVEGPIDDEETLREAISGQDVIISVFGPSSPSPFTNVDVFVPAYKKILATMRNEGVGRIIALSTLSVNDPEDRFSLLRWLLATALWAIAHKVWKAVNDISKVFEEEGDDIDWTLFRVGFLANGPRLRPIHGYVGDGTLGMYLRRADIAEWTLTQADKSPPEFVHRRPGICSVNV
ncbi:NmrA family protein [Hypoxylon rubiginosum]|uniref:NmrA family protein n=1 Tax=Hypoxylon rubiginosum TaxID=110542 RepID=A0ACC0CJP2_9PEZI|nr:NmrA family protein [Hypoxylon rubiginosum]